jgi:hypothetical protein
VLQRLAQHDFDGKNASRSNRSITHATRDLPRIFDGPPLGSLDCFFLIGALLRTEKMEEMEKTPVGQLRG